MQQFSYTQGISTSQQQQQQQQYEQYQAAQQQDQQQQLYPVHLRGSKSTTEMPPINASRGSGSLKSHQVLRSREEQEHILKHLTQPTKSLQLRSQAFLVSKEQSRLQYLKNSRTLDNHFSSNIHLSAWISPGLSIKQKYESDSTGLAMKLKNTDLEVILQQEKGSVQQMYKEGVRNWAEYERIRDQEQILTIEYCTNCHEHQGTTRHDEAKYESVASNLKREILRHFPTVKVYLKPLLSDSSDKSIETQYARSRLGALEVQLCSNRDGKITKTTLFSKLKSKCWPSTNVVLNELRANMKTCSLTVSLVHGLLEPQNLGENQRNNPSENKLVNIEIILTPYRKQQGQSMNANASGFTQTFFDDTRNKNSMIDFESLSKSRPNSAFRTAPNRPFSAQSAFSVKSLGSTLSITQKTTAKKLAIQQKTSPEGIAVFTNLPYDVYTVEIKESNDFKKHRSVTITHCLSDCLTSFHLQQLDVFRKVKEEENSPESIHHEILLESVELTFAKIFIDGDVGSKDSIIRIIKEHDQDNEIEGKMRSEFVTTLEPGKYTIIIENEQSGRIEEEHVFPFGNQELHLSFSADQKPRESTLRTAAHSSDTANNVSKQAQQRPLANPNSAKQTQQQLQQRPGSARPQSASSRASSAKKDLTVFIYEAGNSSKGLAQCKIQIEDDVRGAREFFTDSEGLCIIPQEGFSRGSIRIHHQDFLEICEEFGPNQMNLNAMRELSFPLIRKPETENEVNFLMFSDLDKKILTLHVIAPDGLSSSVSRKDVLIDNNLEQRSSFIKITKAREQSGIYRIYAKVHDLQLLTPASIKFYVVTSAQSLSFIEVPKAHPTFRSSGGGSDLYWDIGALCVPTCKFIEINSVQTDPISKESGLKELKAISDQLKKAVKKEKTSSNSFDVRNLLGFPADDVTVLQSSNDMSVKSEKIVEALSKSISGLSKASPSVLEHLVHSSLMPNGLCSYAKLKAKLLCIEFPEDFTVSSNQAGAVHEASDEDEDEDEEEAAADFENYE